MKYICENCIVNEILKAELLKTQQLGRCSYCGSGSVNVMKSEELIQFGGERLIKSLYSIEHATLYQSGMFFEGSDEISFKPVSDIIQELDVGDEDFEDELADYIISNSVNGTDLFILDYGEHSNNSYEKKWSNFTKSTAHKHRFFNKDAKVFLDSLFEVLVDDGEVKTNAITTVDRNTELFRARIANDDNTRKQVVANPAYQLGRVPEWLAGEQRMTPTGISSLYCALDRNTCFSEVRAITGDCVISGMFKPNEELHLLDLTKIHNLSQLSVDPFNEHFVEFSHRSEFLINLMFLMSKPASRNVSSSYISTQVIFEYLSIKFGRELSGLMFNSVQTGGKGKNVVFFPEYSSVRPSLNSFKNIKSISEFYNDFGGLQYYYYSIEKSPETSSTGRDPKAKLKFIDGSLIISNVEAVITKTEDIKVEISVK